MYVKRIFLLKKWVRIPLSPPFFLPFYLKIQFDWEEWDKSCMSNCVASISLLRKVPRSTWSGLFAFFIPWLIFITKWVIFTLWKINSYKLYANSTFRARVDGSIFLYTNCQRYLRNIQTYNKMALFLACFQARIYLPWKAAAIFKTHFSYIIP